MPSIFNVSFITFILILYTPANKIWIGYIFKDIYIRKIIFKDQIAWLFAKL